MTDNALTRHLTETLGNALPAPALALCQQAPRHRLAKGDALLRENAHWQHLWWLQSGSLRLYYLDRDGQTANKNFYLDGALLWPITPLLAHRAVGFWVEALEDSHVWALPWARWDTAIAAHPPWQALERQVLAALLQEKMQREQDFLQRTALERYQAVLHQHPDWVRRLPLKHLASYLGITDVSLSRIRRRLNKG